MSGRPCASISPTRSIPIRSGTRRDRKFSTSTRGTQAGAGGLGRIAAAPVLPGERVAELDVAGEFEGPEAAVADDLPGLALDECPGTEPALFLRDPVRHKPSAHRVQVVQRFTGDVAHDLRIAIDVDHIRCVSRTKWPDEQALRLDWQGDGHRAH